VMQGHIVLSWGRQWWQCGDNFKESGLNPPTRPSMYAAYKQPSL